MEKIDIKKELKNLYNPSANQVVEVDVPSFNYLMIDGEGDPNTSQIYTEAVEALFSVSYATKFLMKKGAAAIDYSVMPLEGLWWADDMSKFTAADKSNWKWTVMIMQPSFVPRELVDSAIAQVKQKKNLPGLAMLRYETLSEGKCAQTLHIGPFNREGPTIERVHAFIKEAGRKPVGKHHEIYMSDIRKADPAKWKTIIRQPMR